MPVRETLVARLTHGRAVLAELAQQGESEATREQKGYLKALEEILDLEGISLRRHPRRPTDIPAIVERIPPKPDARDRRGTGTIVDLSVGGCGLATAMELSVSEVVELSFRLPDGSTPVTLEGSVRRTQRMDGASRAGVEFNASLRALAEPRPPDPSPFTRRDSPVSERR